MREKKHQIIQMLYISGSYTAVIPAGFTVSGKSGETSIENGLVVTDENGNEWVWIPVEDVTNLYIENKTNTEWILCGTRGENGVISKYASKSEILMGKTRGTPGTTDLYYREPDIVIGDGVEYDNVQINRTQAGFTTLVDMATKLKDDYNKMIDSIRKNGGFYVGRYELGKNISGKPQVKAGAVYNNANWYQLYLACKSFEDNSVYSRMIWGCQWDELCGFIATAKDKNGNIISMTDSSMYGNYTGSLKNTGSNDDYKTNNIYDLAGNCAELTQEAGGTKSRANRGGCFGNTSASEYPITCRSVFNGTTFSTSIFSSRPVLYFK